MMMIERQKSSSKVLNVSLYAWKLSPIPPTVRLLAFVSQLPRKVQFLARLKHEGLSTAELQQMMRY